MKDVDEPGLRGRLSQAADTLDILPAPTDAIVRAGRRAALKNRMLMGTAVVAAVGAGATATLLARPTHAVQQAVPAAQQATTAPTPGPLGPEPIPPRGSVTLGTGTFDGQRWTVTRSYYVDRDAQNKYAWETGEKFTLTLDGVATDSFVSGVSGDTNPEWQNTIPSSTMSGESGVLFLTKDSKLTATHNPPYVQVISVSSRVAKATMNFKNGAPITMTPSKFTQAGTSTEWFVLAQVPANHGTTQNITYYDAHGHVLGSESTSRGRQL